MDVVDPSNATTRGHGDPRVVALFSDLEPRLRQALFAYAGPHEIDDAIGDAFAHLCAQPERILAMRNPHGYLYRVARNASRGARRRTPNLTSPDLHHDPEISPELVPSLERLTANQRTSVFLVSGLGWTWGEVAEFLGTSTSTVRNHHRRGMRKLRQDLGGPS
jgi:DNA-directed RNA polymerase specialized sigma24 family protein